MLQLTATALFIPLMRALLSSLTCTSAGALWQDIPNMPCYGSDGAHITILVLGVPSALALCATAVAYTTLLNECDPLAGNPLSRAHGRVDGVVLLARFLMVLGVCLREHVETRVMVGVGVVVAVLQLGGYLMYLPYHSLRQNQLHTAGAAVFVSSVVWRIMAEVQVESLVRLQVAWP